MLHFFKNLLIYCICTSTLVAQPTFKFHQLAEEQNLLNPVVNDLVQDSLGFVWVATDDGLYRFDGMSFTAFRTTKTRHSLPNNTVNELLSQKQQVWILTNEGVGVYDYLTDKLSHYLPQKKGTNTAPKIFTSIISGPDGTLYLGTIGGGIYVFKNEVLQPYIPSNDLPNIDFEQLNISDLKIKKGVLWVSTWDQGLFHIQLATKQIKHIAAPSLKTPLIINRLFFDAQQKLWLGTNEGLQLLPHYDKVEINLIDYRELIGDEVLSIWEDRHHNLWVGTRNEGLFQVGIRKGGQPFIIHHFKPQTDLESISHYTISAITEDYAGNLWLGTHGRGINIFHPMGEKVVTVQPIPRDLITGRNANRVRGMAESADRGIWLGTQGAGLFYYDISKNKSEKYTSKDSSIILEAAAILSLKETADKKLWVGTNSRNVYQIDLKTKAVRDFVLEKGPASSSIKQINVIHECRNEKIWIGTNKDGLQFYDKKTQQFEQIKATKNLDIRGILDSPTSATSLWMLTTAEGLIKYNMANESITTFNWSNITKTRFPTAFSFAYYRNRIWVGTKESGLVCFDLKTETFALIDESKGLANNAVKSIVPVGEYLWISTNSGVSAYHAETKEIRNFGDAQGLSNGQFNENLGFYSENGQLVFGGINGLNIFKPNILLEKKVLPKLTFTAFRQNNTAVVPNETTQLIDKAVPLAKRVNLGADLDFFSIEFKVLEFPKSYGLNYAYFLEHYDKAWTDNNSVNLATYRNVPSGNYTFHARVIDNATGQEGPSTSIKIFIAPPWWQTWWAYALFAILLMVGLWLFDRYNKARITLKQKLYYEQKLRDQEAQNIQQKISFFTNFSHELRTPITLILGPINDLLRRGNLQEDKRNALFLAKKNAHVLLKLVNRFLEFRKVETENAILNIGQQDLSILAKTEAESFTFLAKEKSVKFSFYCETPLYAWVDIEKIQIVLNNLLANALTYAIEGSQVTFKAYTQNEALRFEVKDEGRGISKAELDRIFEPFYQATNSIGMGGTGLGLALCKSLIEQHQGTIDVESDLGKGTIFSVTLPTGTAHFEGKDHIRFVQNQVETSLLPITTSSLPLAEKELVNEKIMLVVEDHSDIRQYIQSIFAEHFKVIVAQNGKEALQLAIANSPDIILSDIMMPEMDGIAFCKALKENTLTSHIPVLLLTAKSDTISKIEGFKTGALAYIVKPFDAAVLKAQVQNLLQNRAILKAYFTAEQSTLKAPVSNIPPHELDFLEKVAQIILDSFPDGQLTVHSLCRSIGFSRTSLYRKIKSLTDLSIKQFITSVKLKKAAELLAKGDKNISEVAFYLSFSDLKFFRKNFKKQFGMLPSEYQQQQKGNIQIDTQQVKRDLGL